MPTCIALLRGPLDHKQMENWVSTDVFQDHILHVQALVNECSASGELTADAFEIPDDVCPRDIAGLALFDCNTGLVTSRGFQLPALGISVLCDQNIICIRGWLDEAPTVAEYQSDCSIFDDPCALYKELRCCWYKLAKDQQKVSIDFRDRSIKFQPKSQADMDRLERMVLEAKAECDACQGEQSNWRGGYLGHSCARPVRTRGCC